MIRITGGTLRGRTIQSPPTEGIRPTTGLVREALFSQWQGIISECRFLDLFSGSGLMGFEAISRGAGFVMAVEKNRKHGNWIESQRQHLGISTNEMKIQVQTAEKIAAVSPSQLKMTEAFDLLFLDPPYGYSGLDALVQQLWANGWVKPDGGRIVLEQSTQDPLITLENLQSETIKGEVAMKTYGDTRITTLIL